MDYVVTRLMPFIGTRQVSNLKFLLNYLMLKPFCIERFHSRGQHVCKFIGTKENVYRRKEFNSHRTGLGRKHGRRFIVLGRQHGRRDIM